MSDDEYEIDQIRRINMQAEERFAIRLICGVLLALCALCIIGIYLTRG